MMKTTFEKTQVQFFYFKPKSRGRLVIDEKGSEKNQYKDDYINDDILSAFNSLRSLRGC